LQPIEWAFTILSFIAFYFFFGKKASRPDFRLKGFILSIIISILTSIFAFSIGVFSLALINLSYVFLNAVGILNCWHEIKSQKSATSKRTASGTDIKKHLSRG
jgi:hypothetical protein